MLVLAKVALPMMAVAAVLAKVTAYEMVLAVFAVIVMLPEAPLNAESPILTLSSSPTENPWLPIVVRVTTLDAT
jgi:hypothetical protein